VPHKYLGRGRGNGGKGGNKKTLNSKCGWVWSPRNSTRERSRRRGDLLTFEERAKARQLKRRITGGKGSFRSGQAASPHRLLLSENGTGGGREVNWGKETSGFRKWKSKRKKGYQRESQTSLVGDISARGMGEQSREKKTAEEVAIEVTVRDGREARGGAHFSKCRKFSCVEAGRRAFFRAVGAATVRN